MPKRVDIDEKKEMILEAALKVFARSGAAKTKMVDIAAEANIGKGTIYEYFKSKDEIFSSTFYLFMNKIEEFMAQKLFRMYDPMDKLKAYLTCWTEFLQGQNLEYIEIMLDYWAESIRAKHEANQFDMAAFYEENRLFLKHILDECIVKQKIHRVDTNITAAYILGALDGLMLQWIIDRKNFDLQAAIEAFSEVVIDGLKK